MGGGGRRSHRSAVSGSEMRLGGRGSGMAGEGRGCGLELRLQACPHQSPGVPHHVSGRDVRVKPAHVLPLGCPHRSLSLVKRGSRRTAPCTALSMAPRSLLSRGRCLCPRGGGRWGALLRSLEQGGLSVLGPGPVPQLPKGFVRVAPWAGGWGGWGRSPGQGRDGARAWSPHVCHRLPSG